MKKYGWNLMNKIFFLILIFTVCPFLVYAGQLEYSVACNEAQEPISINYGEYTVNCGISPTTDLDQFSFLGSDTDTIRINVKSNTAYLDPSIEVRDPDGAVIADTACNGTSLTCSFSVDLSLTKTGEYLIAIFDENIDNAGDYQFTLQCLFGPCPSVGSSTFMDVPLGHWAYNYVDSLYFSGIVVGCQPDDPQTPLNELMYCPTNPVTRAQMSAYIIRGLVADGTLTQEPDDNYCGTTNPFPDVPYDNWACKYIKRMFELGISNGFPDGNYKPLLQVTRDQMAVYIIRSLYGDSFDFNPTPVFPDVGTNHWAFKYIQELYEENISDGYPDGNYKPTNVVNRAQMAAYVAKAFLGLP
jgi:hypothetical protein